MKKIILTAVLIASYTFCNAQITEDESTGNVGIGVEPSTHKLEVRGTVKGTHGIFSHDGVTANTPLWIGEEVAPNVYNTQYYLNKSAGATDAYFANIIRDKNAKARYQLKVVEENTQLSIYDHNGSEAFKFDVGALGPNKVFMHMMKPDSRIVIGSHGLYEPDHKFVIKNGSALIEGNIYTNNKIGIGLASSDIPTDYDLAVGGNIIAEKVKVQLEDEWEWPDYVFENTYTLPTLNEVSQYIEENGHLKDVPSADEVKENGIFLGEMDAKLLRKIEELTLYTIAQQEEIKKQDVKISKLEEKNKQLNELNKKLEDLQHRIANLEKE
ncbi:hypothetical protein [Kordia sp.]|uniref:hypothetical protein n=1 Tax=Kordia sp. TaxID=1965332 RepID=UPI003B5CFCCB